MQIFVRANKLFSLEVHPTTTLEELKELIQDKEGYPPDIYYLVHCGRILKNGTMKEQNVINESTIHLSFRFGVKRSD